MPHHVNDFLPSPNLTPQDKEDIAKAAAEMVKGDIENISAAYAKDKEDLAAALGTLRESLAKMVTAEVARQLRNPADVAAAQKIVADEQRAEAAKAEAEKNPADSAAAQRVRDDEARLAVDRAAAKNLQPA
jgi:ribosomal protein L29